MAQVLKFWHTWSWAITCSGWLVLVGINLGTYKSAMASLAEGQLAMQIQHDKENADHRITVLEQIASDNRQNFADIKDTEKAIFERINMIADKK